MARRVFQKLIQLQFLRKWTDMAGESRSVDAHAAAIVTARGFSPDRRQL
jgi:hypothetical protein